MTGPDGTTAPSEDVAAGAPPRYLARGKRHTGRPPCGKTARFYPAGWRCDEHRPTAR